MRIRLNQPIVGHKHEDETKRFLHANKDDVLHVILNNGTHFICDSKNYPNKAIVVFTSQCDIVDTDTVKEDPHSDEKFYNVYEDKSNPNLDDPLYTAFESEDSD